MTVFTDMCLMLVWMDINGSVSTKPYSAVI